MDPYDLPEQFSHLQAQDMSKLGFMQDLIRGIRKILETDEPSIVQKEEVVGKKAGVEPLLKRVFMFLDEGNWDRADEYCERILDQDPENARAYIGKLMAFLEINRFEDLANYNGALDSKTDYQNAIRFADDETINLLKKYNESAKNVELYDKAVDRIKTAKTIYNYQITIETLNKIPGFRDADKLIEECTKTIGELENKNEYAAGIVDALKNGRSIQRPEEMLIKTQKRVRTLMELLSSFDEIQSEINTLHKEQETILSQEKTVSQRREKLGIFSGKEKKRLDEEISILLEKKNEISNAIIKNENRLMGYISKEKIEKDIVVEKTAESELVGIIESNKENNKFSFDEALDIYMNDKNIASCVNLLYPKAAFIPLTTGRTKTVMFGHYDDKYSTEQTKPIEWIELTRQDKTILLISKYVIEVDKFDKDGNYTWEKCSLRKWLNDRFLSIAFTKEEMSVIKKVFVKQDPHPERSNIDLGKATQDYVFLLSCAEVEKYFVNAEDRFAYRDNSEDIGSNISETYCDWWLRTRGRVGICCVTNESSMHTYQGLNGSLEVLKPYQGSINTWGKSLTEYGGVRPAIWVEYE